MTSYPRLLSETVNPDGKRDFKELGSRIAQLRKEQDLTQQQLERLSNLPKPKQRAVMEVLEAVLAQASR